jgi:uncharacterized protein YjbJ (UPF0337 family)
MEMESPRNTEDFASETGTSRWSNVTNWDQVRRDSQRRWNKLTDEDLGKIKSNVNELKDIVQERYGMSKDQATQEVERFMSRYDHKVYEMAQSLPAGVRESMERHPWAAVATALGLGFIFGFALKPGSRRDRTHLPS